jgi:hypothetical protein
MGVCSSRSSGAKDNHQADPIVHSSASSSTVTAPASSSPPSSVSPDEVQLEVPSVAPRLPGPLIDNSGELIEIPEEVRSPRVMSELPYEAFSPRGNEENQLTSQDAPFSPTLPPEFDVRSPRAAIPFPPLVGSNVEFSPLNSSDQSIEPLFHEGIQFGRPPLTTHLIAEADIDPRSPRAMLPDSLDIHSPVAVEIPKEVIAVIADPFGLRSPRPILAAETEGFVEPFSPQPNDQPLASSLSNSRVFLAGAPIHKMKK